MTTEVTTNDKQRLYVIPCDGSYSVSTSKTQSWLMQAIRHENLIHVHGVRMGTRTLFDSYHPKQWAREQVKASLKRAGDAIAQSKRRRKEWGRLDDIRIANHEMQQARKLRELFDKRISIPADMDGLAASAEKARKAEAKREKARQTKRMGDIFMLITSFLVTHEGKRRDLQSRYERRIK